MNKFILRNIISSLVSLCSLTGYSQQKTDTIIIKKKDFDMCFSINYTLTASNKKYYFNDKEISGEDFEKIKYTSDSICNLINKAMGQYCKIYDDSVLIEEGVCYPEYFTGYYKSYYHNGFVKEEGCYTDENGKYEPGQKVGKWIYYDKAGKIKYNKNYIPQISRND